MIASLPMYDWRELASSTDALWNELASQLQAHGINAPDKLSRSDDDTSFALAPDLLLGQTCGYPLATRLKGKVHYLTTPVYDVEGCDGAYPINCVSGHIVTSELLGESHGYQTGNYR